MKRGRKKSISSHFYDDEEFDYPQYWRGREYEDLAERIALKKFLSLVKKIGTGETKFRVLDIGAGYGRLADVYLPISEEITFLEPSARLLNLAEKRLREFRGRTKINFLPATIEKIQLPQNFYDLVLAIRVIHHLENPIILFKKAFLSLKPGGFFVLEFANKNNFKLFVRALWNRDARRELRLSRVDRRSSESIKKGAIPFYNYHPLWIEKSLIQNGYQIKKILSVSNFRHQLLKKIFPLFVLAWLESISQVLFSPFSFAPSIFILSRKPSNK